MTTDERAAIRFASIALQTNPKMTLTKFCSMSGVWQGVRTDIEYLTAEHVVALSEAFDVREDYWSPDLRESQVRHMAAAPTRFDRLNFDVDTWVLTRVVWLNLIWRGEAGQMITSNPQARGIHGYAIEHMGSTSGAKSLLLSLKRGTPSSRTMQSASELFDVPTAYWTLTDYDDARAVASGEKTIGVIAA